MSRTHYFYFRLGVSELDQIVKVHQTEFDQFLKDNFDDHELAPFETMLDSIAAIYVQPILPDLTFDDFYASENEEESQRVFFNAARSSICLENLPYFESNPFQVSYLIQLLERFDEVLIDQGGVNELIFKSNYLKELRKHKSMESLLGASQVKPAVISKPNRPVDPIDFLILDVYRELDRLGTAAHVAGQSEKVQKIFRAFQGDRADATELYRRSGLSPKDFDDCLERLKFWLRSL